MAELIIHTPSKKKFTLILVQDALHIQKEGSKLKKIQLRQVLEAEYKSKTVQVSFIHKSKSSFHLVRLEGKPQGDPEIASNWTEKVTKAAYEGLGVKRGRRLRVLVNPHGGTGKSVSVFTQKVEPVFRAAGCILDVTHTTHNGHAQEIAKGLSLDYDGIISVSGDGLVHEIMNGLAQHATPLKAFAMPIAPIPTGSGNGLALNLLGLEYGFDVVYAALNAVKGSPMDIDVFSFVQGGKRTISFMSQAMGLMADLDIGTENLRWMGDTRFVVGFLRGLIPFKSCPIELSFKAAPKDKDTMARERQESLNRVSAPSSARKHPEGDSLPPLRFETETEGWTTFDKPMLFLYCGKGPYVARDYMAFPASTPDDGFIDVVIQTLSSRGEVIGALNSAPQGGSFWKDSCHYVKASAFRVKPLVAKGILSVDGESFPFEPFHVEVHPGMATLLSLSGHYVAPFPPKPN